MLYVWASPIYHFRDSYHKKIWLCRRTDKLYKPIVHWESLIFTLHWTALFLWLLRWWWNSQRSSHCSQGSCFFYFPAPCESEFVNDRESRSRCCTWFGFLCMRALLQCILSSQSSCRLSGLFQPCIWTLFGQTIGMWFRRALKSENTICLVTCWVVRTEREIQERMRTVRIKYYNDYFLSTPKPWYWWEYPHSSKNWSQQRRVPNTFNEICHSSTNADTQKWKWLSKTIPEQMIFWTTKPCAENRFIKEMRNSTVAKKN